MAVLACGGGAESLALRGGRMGRGRAAHRDRVSETKGSAMSIAIALPLPLTTGEVTFDRYHYDATADVLYLHLYKEPETVDWDGTDEGHGVQFDAEGKLIGATLVNARWLLERDGT